MDRRRSTKQTDTDTDDADGESSIYRYSSSSIERSGSEDSQCSVSLSPRAAHPQAHFDCESQEHHNWGRRKRKPDKNAGYDQVGSLVPPPRSPKRKGGGYNKITTLRRQEDGGQGIGWTNRRWETVNDDPVGISSSHSIGFPQLVLDEYTHPPPLLVRSSRLLSLPGAFPIEGTGGSRTYHGEEEKHEDEPSAPSHESNRSDFIHDFEDILLEATLVTEIDEDAEISTNELVEAEPLRRWCSARVICLLIVALLLIAFVGVASGTELGRRHYGTTLTVATRNSSSLTASPTDFTSATMNSGTELSTELSSREPSSANPSTSTPAPHDSVLTTTNTSDGQSTFASVEEALPEKSRQSLQDSNSPQSKAYRWLQEDPQLQKYSIDRKLQRFALVTFFYASDGERWENRDHWLSYDVPECEWLSDAPSGLVCNESGGDSQYKILSLNQNPPNGTLAEETWLLSSLVSLALYKQNLNGTIPKRIGKMTQLETLALFELSLEGSIPKEISSVPLKSLYFNDNRLNSSLPTEIGQLVNLKELALHNNRFSGTIATEIGALSDLKLAYIGNNSLSGPIPSELSNLVELEALLLQSNTLTGTIPDLSKLNKVQHIFFGSNLLTGTISPQMIASWRHLIVLDFGACQLTGSIPSEVGYLSQMEVIDLFDNSIAGKLPTELGLLSNAKKVMLENNHIQGAVPSEFGRLIDLERLWLHDNPGLSGTVPFELCALIEKGSLDLSVDCLKVACTCGCNCEISTQPTPTDDGDTVQEELDSKEEESSNLWDNFLGFVSDIFN